MCRSVERAGRYWKSARTQRSSEPGVDSARHLDNYSRQPQLPDGWDEWSEEKRKDWGKSRQEAQLQLQKAQRYYAFAIEEDRSFRVEDVAPGTYRLSLEVYEETARNRVSVASAEVEAKIDEIPGGQTDEPLDVGTLE